MHVLKIGFYWSIVLLAFYSCHLAGKCELRQVWKVQRYAIQKMECPDLVLRSYYNYEVLLDDQQLEIGADKIDSCRFTPRHGSCLTNHSYKPTTSNILFLNIAQIKKRLYLNSLMYVDKINGEAIMKQAIDDL